MHTPHIISSGLLGLSLVASLAFAEPEQPLQPAAPAAPAAETTEAAILKQLQQSVTVEFKETPLKQALAELSTKTGTNIVINGRHLEDEGISLDHPVSQQLKDINAETALHLLLRPLGLRWVIQEEVVQITTYSEATDAEEHGIVRVYDVSNLLRLAKSTGKPVPAAQPAAAQFSIPPGLKQAGDLVPGEFEGFYFHGPRVTQHPPAGEHAWLIDAIQTSTASSPGSSEALWMDIDGSGGTITLVGKSLVVSHTFQTQRKIAALLQALEVAYAQAPAARLFPVGSPGSSSLQTEAQILADLNKPAELKAVEMPLNEVLNVIATQLGHPVWMDQLSMDEEGIQPDEPVSVELNGVTLRSALKIILSRFGLVHTVWEGVLYVTTEHAEESMNYPRLAICHLGHHPKPLLDQVTESIQEHTGASWNDIDGVGGTISICPGGVLVIKQSESGLRSVEKLLDQLIPKLLQPRTPVEAEKPDADGMVIRYYRMPDANLCQQLQKALPELVGPAEWKPNAAAIHSFDTTLVIRQTPAMQQRITDWLTELAQHLDLTRYPTTDLKGLHFTPGPTRQTGGGFFSVN